VRSRPARVATGGVLTVVAFCLVAANMRGAITAVGPVLDEIGADTGMSTAVLGAITSVPLLTWALVSPFAHGVSRRFGLSAAVLGALGLLAAGALVRSAPGPVAFIWVGTVLIGVALALGNVLMPAAVKRDFPNAVPLMMGVYSALLGGFGALASGIAVPLAHLPVDGGEAGWRFALVITAAVLLIPAVPAWAWAARRRRQRADAAGPDPAASVPDLRRRGAIWRDRVAWLVAGYMGMQATTFYVLVTWLATVSTSLGRSPAEAGVDVMTYQLASLIGSLGLPVLLRGRGARVAPALLPTIGLLGIAGLLLAPSLLVLWVCVLGVFSGASLSMALTLMAQRARTTDDATALSGMAQAVGYTITAIGPLAFGALHAWEGGWTLPLLLVAASMVAQAVIGVPAGRDRHVLEPR